MAENDPDGVRVIATGSRGRRITLALQGAALFLASACVGYVVMPRTEAPPPAPPPMLRTKSFVHEPQAPPPASGSQAAAPAAAGTPESNAAPVAAPVVTSMRNLTPRRVGTPKPEEKAPDLDDIGEQLRSLPPDQRPTMAEVIKAGQAQGRTDGIFAFGIPGTSPPIEGLEVPDDYVLPDGYVRHYQATDDGQRINPILMYSPDYKFYDANGNEVEIPPDRVVTPDNAPPGFPIHKVVIPPPRPPGNLRR
ncbi:MAG TPA: hypothetical protein VGK20_01380 [Candidatus Binatia bacterium]|jgi:hypothetical protein